MENIDYNDAHFPITQRVKVFFCSCCPPNLNRFLSVLDNYIYSTDNGAYYINQFTSSEMNHEGAYIKQTTNYPVSGEIKIECNNVKILMIRKPSWCDEFTINADYEMNNGYIRIKNPPKEIDVNFIMRPKIMSADARVINVVSKTALMYGPIVYCVEGVDNGGDISSLFVDSKNRNFEVTYNKDFGLNVISAGGFRRKKSDKLYYEYNPEFENTKINFIPYSCFANRGETDMAVWVNVR